MRQQPRQRLSEWYRLWLLLLALSFGYFLKVASFERVGAFVTINDNRYLVAIYERDSPGLSVGSNPNASAANAPSVA